MEIYSILLRISKVDAKPSRYAAFLTLVGWWIYCRVFRQGRELFIFHLTMFIQVPPYYYESY